MIISPNRLEEAQKEFDAVKARHKDAYIAKRKAEIEYEHSKRDLSTASAKLCNEALKAGVPLG